jgi:hypothetical protein
MQMVKIQIPDKDGCARTFAALIRRGRVDCFRDIFTVPEPALEHVWGFSLAAELTGYAVAVFAAGRGVWRYALRRPVWARTKSLLGLRRGAIR